MSSTNSSDLLKEELNNLKNKLEDIETELEDRLKEVNIREEKWKVMENQVNQIFQTNKRQVVKFKVGGKKFATSIDSLQRVNNTLFYKIANSNRFDFSQEIFIDRSPSFFPYILDYLRGNEINYRQFKREEREELLMEAEYYELDEIIENIKEMMKDIEFVGCEINKPYIYSGKTVGTNRVEDLKDISATKGITASSPGCIIIEFNSEWEFDEIEISGYNGNKTAWYPGNGSGAKIETSSDKLNWKSVGTLPSSYGATMSKINVTKSQAKYIKFVHSTFLGIGYLNIIKSK